MSRPWILLGGGGHAGVVLDTLLALGHSVIGYTAPAPGARQIPGIEYLGVDEAVDEFDPEQVFLANGLGSTSDTSQRAALYHRFAERGFSFGSVVHPSAVVASAVWLGAGTQVMAGAILQTGCRVAENVLINTRACVDHDCVIEAHVHVAPGATVSGFVVIEEGAHIGAGSTIIQCVRIGARSVVGAGAVVVRDVKEHTTVLGMPARRRDV